jgi:hypothetical protein
MRNHNPAGRFAWATCLPLFWALAVIADPVAAELEAALALRRSGADPKALRRALRWIEELLDE